MCRSLGRQVPGALPKYWEIAGGEGGVGQSSCPGGAGEAVSLSSTLLWQSWCREPAE